MANVIKKVKIGTTEYDIHAKTADSATNATNATNATKATQDSAGQQINTTYIKGLSASGTTITYTKGDGTTGTITTQDTTYSAATTSANGLMSSSDKTKLNGISTSAKNIVVSSTQPTNQSSGDFWYKVV